MASSRDRRSASRALAASRLSYRTSSWSAGGTGAGGTGAGGTRVSDLWPSLGGGKRAGGSTCKSLPATCGHARHACTPCAHAHAHRLRLPPRPRPAAAPRPSAAGCRRRCAPRPAPPRGSTAWPAWRQRGSAGRENPGWRGAGGVGWVGGSLEDGVQCAQRREAWRQAGRRAGRQAGGPHQAHPTHPTLTASRAAAAGPAPPPPPPALRPWLGRRVPGPQAGAPQSAAAG